MQDQNNLNNYKNNLVIQNNNNIKNLKMDLLDGDLVSLINELIKKFKEYYQVSSNNCSGMNQIFLYYKEAHLNLKLLLNNIIMNKKYEKINEVFEKINSFGEIISQLQENSDSFLQNLNLFFEDAKIIFKIIQTQRQKQLIKDTKNKNFNEINKFKKNSQINRLYEEITNMVNKLSDFDYIIENTDSDSAIYYNYLKNSIKNNLGELINYIMKFIDENSRRTRNKTNYDLSKEIEEIKMTERIKDKKIRDLTETITKMKTKYNKNSDLNAINLLNSNERNIKSILSEKNNIISTLQKEINIYEKNEIILNKQLDDLNNQFQAKMNQYESQIKNLKVKLSTNINNKNGLLLNSIDNSNTKNKDNVYLNTEFDLNTRTLNNFENINILKNKNINLMKQIKKQKLIINNLNKELENNKNILDKIDKMNKHQIEEINNNIYNNNKIIEQKDELIKQLQQKKELSNAHININIGNQNNINNNQVLLLKLENEKLKNEISLLKDNNNQNSNNISSLKAKNSELEEKIVKLNNKIEQQKNIINNLKSEISKKKEQIEGMNDFIAKLQSKIENYDLIFQKKDSKKISNPEYELNEINNRSSPDITEKMKNLLDLLNKANKEIATLQKLNKELQFKLKDKKLEEELSGYKTEEVNFSTYEEEFDLKKIINRAKIQNKSEDIYIDYPGVQGIINKYKNLQVKMSVLEEQVKILLCNIDCNNYKIKPQINQICQLMKIPAKNVELIFAGKNKKKIFGLID